jgi:hypothetical protein
MINFITEKPKEGAYFKFEVTAENSKVFVHEIVARIDGQIAYKKTIECIDPPCHEMFFISGGRKLSIEYGNNTGAFKKFDFNILPETNKFNS